MFRLKTLLFIIFILIFNLKAEEPEIGIIEKTGNVLPQGLTFVDENNNQVSFSQLLNRPALLTLVYYECPGICTPLLSGIADVLNRVELQPGRDFNVITVSFNPEDDPELAMEKKENYLKVLKKKIPQDGWRFLTGNEENIKKLTEAVGFKYKKDGDEFIHPAVVIVLSEKGKIVRYLHGIEFLPLDIKMSIADAYEEKSAPPLLRVARLCYKYSPEGRKYVLNILAITSIISIGLAGGLFIALVFKGRRK